MKRIISVLLAVLILSSVFVMPASAASTQSAEDKYEDRWLQYLTNCGEGPDYEGQTNWYSYGELYEYYSDDNTSQTPDWVLVSGCTTGMAPSFCYGVFDKYYIVENNCYTPYNLAYYIYLPSRNMFYTLDFAWIEKFENIDKAFSECLVPEGRAHLIEDSNADGVIDAVDAAKVAQGVKVFNSYDERLNLYFDVNKSGWKDYNTIYYSVMNAEGNYVHYPNMKPSFCSDYDGDGVFRCDITRISSIFNREPEYQLYFTNDKGDETTKVTLTKDNIGETLYCIGETDSEGKPVIEWKKESGTLISVKDALADYEAETGEKLETNRYYFLMPNGKNGVYYIDGGVQFPEMDNQDIIDKGYGYFAPSWFNKYTDTAGIWWYGAEQFNTGSWPGYAMEKTEESDVFYADVPKDVETLMFNNTIDAGMDINSPLREYEKFTNDVAVCGYEPGEKACYPDGIESFDNMIFVLDPSYKSAALSDREERACNGDWYYYYGGGCYGDEKDGRKKAHCLRWDHNHQWLSEGNFYLAGDEGLCGADWDTTSYQSMLDLRYKYESKTFELTRNEVPKGTHEFAVYIDTTTEVVRGSVDVKYDHARVRIVYDPYENTVKAEVIPLLHFDTTTTNWKNFTRVYCHIWEKEGDSFYGFQSLNSRCADDDGDGIWTYDLEAKNIKLEEGKTYGVIFSNEKMFQTRELEFDTELLGDTAYATQFGSPTSEKISPIAWDSQKWQISVKEAVAQYEELTGGTLRTNRYYFLMPDGTNGVQCKDTECIESGHYADSWYNEFADEPAVYWWRSIVAQPKKMPGHTLEKGDADGVFYADIPEAVDEIIWNNNVETTGKTDDPMLDYRMLSVNVGTRYYDPGESENYPDGTPSFDNMIYVIYPHTVNTGEVIVGNRPVAGEWYYYYGKGCYGIVRGGNQDNCIRDDHDHTINYIHFDANTTDWKDYENVYCHIWEFDGDMDSKLQANHELCTDEDGDGIWSYNLDDAGIILEPTKKYTVTFTTGKGELVYGLQLRNTHIGNTAYMTDKTVTINDTEYRIPEWRTQQLHFDANTTGWKNFNKIYCHIWEYGKEPFFIWQQKAELCTDKDGDGIWTYDLAAKGVELERGKQYAVIFSNENGYQTFNLLFDTTVLGDTAYCDGERYENQDGGSRNPEFAYWRNQDDSEAGPEMRINMIGEVTGTCIPKGKTAYDLFKDFLENNFENAQIYSGKTDQQLLDDLAKALKLSSNDVERALKETGIKDVDWKHPDKLSVNDAVTNYEEKTGENVDTIRYYFLMPNGKNGQLKTDTVGGNPYASSWYNTYADKPGVYWWDVKSYDPPRFPGYYLEKSDSKDVYYAYLPKEVKEVIWNNFIFASMDTIDDPMYAYSCQTKETVLPHQIYSSMPNEEPSFIYVVDPDTENTSEFSGKKTIDGNWYYYYGNGCYGNTYGGECIRGDHDHTIRDTYIVAGVEALCGSSWDLFDTNNQMTFNKKTGAYEITYTDVPVGNHEFMVTKNFEFGPITPGNPDYNEAKVTVEGSLVKITYKEGVGVSVEVTPPLLGDVDGDGVISIMDATEIQLAVAKKITLTEEQEKYADTDFDKEVSVMDATAIQLFVAKKITEFK